MIPRSTCIMKIQFIFKIIPILVIYSDFLLKPWMAGRSFGILVIIRESSKDSRGVLAHELTHCEQYFAFTITAGLVIGVASMVWGSNPYAWILLPSLFPFAFKFITSFRYDMEVAAYRVHLKYSPGSRDHFARSLVREYKLSDGYTFNRVYRDLGGVGTG